MIQLLILIFPTRFQLSIGLLVKQVPTLMGEFRFTDKGRRVGGALNNNRGGSGWMGREQDLKGGH